MSAHTPGPWLIRHFGRIPGAVVGGVMRQYTNGEAQDQLATVSAVQPDNGGTEAMEANARLIAAAPELLSALKGVVQVADRATDEFDAARAAIAKAEGRT